MDALDWVRGPMLMVALVVFVVGCAWRLIALWRLPHLTPHGKARRHVDLSAQSSVALRRFGVPGWFPGSATLATINPYVFHIGLFLVFFGYAPHIAFVSRLTGLHWPALPDAVMYVAAGASIISLLIALMFRLTDPVLRRISNADDIITWALTMAPILTGMAVVSEPSVQQMAHQHTIYRGPLALHLASVELFLIWFPFGKLMHAFLAIPGRMQLTAFLGRRGVRA